jgi:hypothetical protein
MMQVVFDKVNAERFLDSINHGKAIQSPPGGWTGHALLALAGACFCSAYRIVIAEERETRGFNQLAPEDQRAREDKVFRTLHGAIQSYHQLTLWVEYGMYNSSGFQAHCEGIVACRAANDGWTFQKGKGMPQESSMPAAQPGSRV